MKVQIVDEGYAVTNKAINNLRNQDGDPYYLGYINYQTPKETSCAVKIINLDSEDTKMSAQREKEVLLKVNHWNIANTYKIIEFQNKMYIFKEYEEQITLQSVFTKIQGSQINENDILSLASQLINCLNYMESLELANRDLNPANILYNREQVFKIFDFGSSRTFDKVSIMKSLVLGRNEFYMSPQMLEVDQSEINYYKSDIWSLGMILYYFGEGQYPWRRKIESHDLDDEIEKMSSRPLQFLKIKSSLLQTLIKKMLVYDQDQRASSQQLLEHFNERQEQPKQNSQLLVNNLQKYSDLVQQMLELKSQQELDETYEETLFNHLIREFTEKKNYIKKDPQIHKSYKQILDYQMFGRKQIWQKFKTQYTTKKLLKKYVLEFKRSSTLSDRSQKELNLLLQVIDFQKKISSDLQTQIQEIENIYLKD